MYYTFCAKTDPGLIRRNNEDAVLVDENCGVAVLADGMGGYNAGEVASGMATTMIATELPRCLSGSAPLSHPADLCRALATSVDRANQAILQAATDSSDCAGMGTTLVAGIFQVDRLYLTHVGDSRCYLLRDETLTQITTDHSLRQELIDAGLITREKAAHARGRNLLTRALGVDAKVPVEVRTFQVVPGDLYLMCSDGLTDMVDDACMTSLMVQEKNMAKLASALINLANAKGGRDNIGVILIHAIDVPDKPGKLSRLFAG
ncbi:Stp1/IreP family PP2C-type Ser/Thr phosphatase [Rhodoferax sp.]|uniref:Stp1/IreP family PP2C-type Ser/Thr phosphatase n=1 Tax=Rhodoferax sp. TaxID=50421 RepID=UPI0019DE6F6B|nr:Stp1/IreP family PP2C-type Ser/Thr phosphatase [Rhodoferax sp.]MBE0475082.1 Stp1/IreP family PP2C-type Ser/Thr phosphatase [Rhodoferax sp.]